MKAYQAIANRVSALKRPFSRIVQHQGGALLLETVMVMSVFGVLGTTVLGAVQTSFTGKNRFDDQSVAENLIRNQIEYVFEQAYVPPVGTYLSVQPLDGFTVTADALVYDVSSTDIETVLITVYKPDSQSYKTFETIRANR